MRAKISRGGHIQRIPSLAQSLSQSFGHHSSPTGCTISLDSGIPVKIRYLGMIRTIPWLLGIKTNCLRKHSIYIPTPQWKGWDLWGVQKHPQVFPDFPVILLNLHVDAISVWSWRICQESPITCREMLISSTQDVCLLTVRCSWERCWPVALSGWDHLGNITTNPLSFGPSEHLSFSSDIPWDHFNPTIPQSGIRDNPS